MKKVKLKELEDNKVNKLKQYKLDKDSINEFKSKIKQVSLNETTKLSTELSNLIINPNFNDNYEKVIELIYNGANVNYLIIEDSLLDICINNDYINTIIVLLRAGIFINTKNKFENTPIMVCAEAGNKEILELLILMGADVNIKNSVGENALSFALKNNHKECADILINAQVQLNCRIINNDSLIDTGESNSSLHVSQDKSIYPVKEEKLSADDLINEAEDLLNKLSNEIKFDLLSKDQIFGNNQLDIISKYGTKCAITDFAILLGGYVSYFNYTNEGNTLKNRTGLWWTQTPYGPDKARAVENDGYISWYFVSSYDVGARPALSYCSIRSISSNVVRGINGINEIEYGEYPQTIVDASYSRELETAYNNRNLGTTGKIYTTYLFRDLVNNIRTHTEYEYKGSKFIRIYGDWDCCGEFLSDGRQIKFGKIYWVKVEPIIWLVDEKSNIALSKKILVSGIQFDNSNQYDGVFENTFMYKYLNEIFAKDIIPSKQLYNKQLIKK